MKKVILYFLLTALIFISLSFFVQMGTVLGNGEFVLMGAQIVFWSGVVVMVIAEGLLIVKGCKKLMGFFTTMTKDDNKEV